jgi:hypothetical protein
MLNTFLESDPYIQNKTNDYQVRSLYFDTIYNKDLDEKLDGILLREKVRLRVYNDHSVIKLEFKKRESSSIDKSTFVISKELADDIINGDYTINSIKSKYGSKMVKPLIKLKSVGYKPRVIVEYDREAYTLPFGNTRITIDKNLRSYNNEIDLFNIKYPSTPTFNDNLQILEVKFSHYLPQSVKYLLSGIDAIPHSISKYTLCQKYINTRPWTDNLSVPF